MSKTIDLQIEKSARLIEALRAHIGEFTSKGITTTDLDDMSDNLNRLKESSRTTEDIRARLSAQVKTTSHILSQAKEAYAKAKAVVRSNYPQEEWIKYGVVDKR